MFNLDLFSFLGYAYHDYRGAMTYAPATINDKNEYIDPTFVSIYNKLVDYVDFITRPANLETVVAEQKKQITLQNKQLKQRAEIKIVTPWTFKIYSYGFWFVLLLLFIVYTVK